MKTKRIKKSHRIWNKNNPHDKIKGGKYKDVIHHKDRDHNNDAPKNQQKMPFGKHISLHQSGRTLLKKTKDKISKANKGRIVTSKTRIKLSKAGKGRLKTTGFTGRKHSEKTKRKMSESGKGKNLGHKYWLGKKHSKETKERMKLAWEKRRADAKKKVA